jgi:hypothetical protein
MPALRILMVNYEFPPLGGGTGQACSQLLDELADRRDVEIDLVTSGAASGLERLALARNIELHRVPTPKRDLHYWRAGELFTWTRRALRYADALTTERAYALRASSGTSFAPKRPTWCRCAARTYPATTRACASSTRC